MGRSWGGVGVKKTRRRLQRTPPRPGGHRVTRISVSAPLYGRCLLLEANLCADCRWTRTEHEPASNLRRSDDNVKGFLFPSLPQLKWLGERLVRQRGGKRLVQEKHLLDRQHVAHEHGARRDPREANDPQAIVRRRLLGGVLHRSK